MLGRCAHNAVEEGVSIRPLAEEAGGKTPAIELGCVTWAELPQRFSPGEFDAAMCRGHAIYNLTTKEDIVATLRNIAGVVRSGGLVLADTLDWTDDLRGQRDRGDVKFRGWLPSSHPLNPVNKRVMFLDTCDYRDESTAVRGVVQTKTLHVIAAENGIASPVVDVSVHGAPFTVEDLAEMMEVAGLVQIRERPLKGHTPYWPTGVGIVP